MEDIINVIVYGTPYGIPGATGPQGPVGPGNTLMGPTGNTGPTGPQGNTGSTGAGSTAPGPTGPQGNSGPQGNTGPTGPQGTTGSTGNTGATGLAGDIYKSTGTAGITLAGICSGSGVTLTVPSGLAYSKVQNVLVAAGLCQSFIATVNSYSGVTLSLIVNSVTGTAYSDSWDVNLNGAVGQQGPPGTPGIQGPTGSQGNTGNTGATGNRGNTGTTGAGYLSGSAQEIEMGSLSVGDSYPISVSSTPAPAYSIGQTLLIYDTVDPNNYFTGTITNWVSATNIVTLTLTKIVGTTTSTSWILNLFGQQGPQGNTGATGATGNNGTNGTNGNTGATGPQGNTGNNGNTGATGPVGDYVISFNGLTGAVTGVTTGTANNFVALQSFSAGISAAGGVTFAGDIAVNGGDITTTSATATVFNTTATNLSIGSAATSLTMGGTSGTASIRNSTLRLGNTTNTIDTNSGTTNSLTLQPYGNISLAPTTTAISVGGSATTLVVNNGVDSTGQVQISGGDLYLGAKTTDGDDSFPVNIIFEGATNNTNETTLTVVDPTADRTITFPDASGTVALTSGLVSSLSGSTYISVSGSTGAVTITNTGVQTFNGLTGAVTGVASIRGLTGAVGITNGTGIGLSVSGQTMTFSNTGVLSVNGSTGTITNVAKTDVNNQFTATQTFNSNVVVLDNTITVFDDSVDHSIILNANTDTIRFYNDDTGNILDLYAGGNFGNQVIAFPSSTTILAGLAVSQTFTDTNTFNSLTNFLSGISAAGGVTFAGTLKGVTASFTGLVSSTVGFSGPATNLRGIVTQVNGLTGGITFAAGTGITFSTSGNIITVASAPNTTTQTLNFSESINGLEIVFYNLGGDYSTSLQYIENDTLSNIYLTINSIGDYYGTFTSIKSFYDATNGWSAKLLLKPPFTDISNPFITTTAEAIYANGIIQIYFIPSSLENEEFWTSFASTDIYHQDATYVTKTVTGQAWVAADSYIECKVLGLTTADHTPEDAILEGVKFEINNIVAGTGFDIMGYASEGTYGKYTIKCLGQ